MSKGIWIVALDTGTVGPGLEASPMRLTAIVLTRRGGDGMIKWKKGLYKKGVSSVPGTPLV